jgi:hypothetical protein
MNIYNSKLKKKLANNLLEKLVLLLLVWYAIACHAITVTNLHFTWYSVVINLMFNTVKPLSIFSERNIKNKQWMQEKNSCETVMYSKIFGRAIWKLSLQCRVFFLITNYQGFQNIQVNLYEFFVIKISIIMKYWITEFQINQVLLYIHWNNIYHSTTIFNILAYPQDLLYKMLSSEVVSQLESKTHDNKFSETMITILISFSYKLMSKQTLYMPQVACSQSLT